MSFTSIEDYVTPLSDLVGEQQARLDLEDWASSQTALIDDAAFADKFSGHFEKFVADPLEYTPRIVATQHGELLAGIRFLGGQASSAFVDIIAWNGEVDIDLWREPIKREWRRFQPERMRLLLPTDRIDQQMEIDQTIHAERFDRMPPANPEVQLRPAENPAEAVELAEDKYDWIEARYPELAEQLYVSDEQALQGCRQKGTLDFIMLGKQVVGVLATKPGKIAFLKGHEIIEEYVKVGFEGQGLAAKAQTQLARKLVASDPVGQLIGSIVRPNIASRKTAERAGRKARFAYGFASLN